MRLLYFILITITAFSSCNKKSPDAGVNNTNTGVTNTRPVTDSLSYIALGDSYTIGQSVPPDQSYPVQLATQMSAKGKPVKEPMIIAVTGWTTGQLIDAIANSGITDRKYDMVTLLIGVNDQYQGLSKDSYKIRFQQILETAIKFAGGKKQHVFVLSIPDYGVTPFANGEESKIGPEIDQFNAINKDISTKAGVNYLDITGISKKAATDVSLIAADGLHPSAKMYGLWVEQLLPMITEKLK